MAMQNKNQLKADRLAAAAVVDNRLDVKTALNVNHGIAVASLENLTRALDLMHADGVPAAICLRVLTDKSRRRASDWK